MTWDSTSPISWLNQQISWLKEQDDIEDQETTGTVLHTTDSPTDSLLHPTFFPVTEIETVARRIILEDYQDDPYCAELAVRIRSALNTLDLFRETGFTLSTPESIITSLENMCAMF